MPIRDWIRRLASIRSISELQATERVADVIAIRLGYRPIYWMDYAQAIDRLNGLDYS